jgi:hypothetical protein
VPSKRLRAVAVVLVALVALSATVAAVANTGPSHRLEGVAVNTVTDESADVRVQVYDAGGDRLVADRTVTVEGPEFTPTENGTDTGSGITTAGETTVTEGWAGPGNDAVRARQPGRTEWSRVALGPGERANDPPWWIDLLRRFGLDDDCFGVRVTVDDGAASGVSASATGCNVIDG